MSGTAAAGNVDAERGRPGLCRWGSSLCGVAPSTSTLAGVASAQAQRLAAVSSAEAAPRRRPSGPSATARDSDVTG
jgi:hypothetical protein